MYLFLSLFILFTAFSVNASEYEGEYIPAVVIGDGILEGHDFSNRMIGDFCGEMCSCVLNCSFRNTVIKRFQFEGRFVDCDFTNCLIESGTLDMNSEDFIKTRNFQSRKLSLPTTWMRLDEMDLSDFEFQENDFHRISISGSKLTNVLFQDCTPPKMTESQLAETRNFQNGNFYRIDFQGMPIMKTDLSRQVFGNVWSRVVEGSFPTLVLGPNVSLKNTVFLLADLSQAEELTVEQVRETWNFRNGKMSLVHWPKHIAEKFDLPKFAQKVGQKAEGLFVRCTFDAAVPIPEFSGTAFCECVFQCSLYNTDLTECVLVQCDLSTVEDLTLEQVKSTWNYKAGRMSLCKWPEYIEKALEEEKKQ